MKQNAATAHRAGGRTMNDLLRDCERRRGPGPPETVIRLRQGSGGGRRNLTVRPEHTTIKLMRSYRARRSFVLVALVIIALGAVVPSIAMHVDEAVLPPLAFVGLVVPVAAVVVIRRIAVRSDLQTVALRSIDGFRAPPFSS